MNSNNFEGYTVEEFFSRGGSAPTPAKLADLGNFAQLKESGVGREIIQDYLGSPWDKSEFGKTEVVGFRGQEIDKKDSYTGFSQRNSVLPSGITKKQSLGR